MTSVVESNSLFQIDGELDDLLEEMQLQAEGGCEVPPELIARFHCFCNAHGEKVDRIGRFVRMMESREQHCRNEAARLGDRARATANKVERTKSMVLYYLVSRDLKKVEGQEFTLRIQKNSQDSVKVTDEEAIPTAYRRIEARMDGTLWQTVLSLLPDELSKSLEMCVHEARPDSEAIKSAVSRQEEVPGALVQRGSHLRVA
ncbi:siphovirus Gp157 family protein [Acidicapsa ligni]|uniref:siphovirus Gp157 family protein n=1 Tax=Acidicapsa ligni TaxID=542300 RepID=UPI0021DF4991|nr:siphovirus Gp157 family protein [Acidicapsa ligni]